mmetsp:Transcript_23189/g.41819  ORF Transcript_23189/g.41819 Transcript_23189/m.41819 type:complete len:85 (+) Transcript_23189:665-919(+)
MIYLDFVSQHASWTHQQVKLQKYPFPLSNPLLSPPPPSNHEYCLYIDEMLTVPELSTHEDHPCQFQTTYFIHSSCPPSESNSGG